MRGLPIPIGVRPQGLLVEDLTQFPHMIVAGETGSGKSVFLRQLITWLAEHNPSGRVQLDLVDLKRVELRDFWLLPHTRSKSVEVDEVRQLLYDLMRELDRRMRLFEQHGVVNVTEYNEGANWLPYRVVIIDEYADLSEEKDMQQLVLHLARKARFVGIHLILSTQRPDVKVITGSIKVNVPARLCFHVFSQTDSRVVLDMHGAERLSRPGQGIFRWRGEPQIVQVLYLSAQEARQRCQSIHEREVKSATLKS